MGNWLFRWLSKPAQQEKLLLGLFKHQAMMPLWKGTAYRPGSSAAGVWHKDLPTARLGMPTGSSIYKLPVTSAIDIEQVARFLAKWFPEHKTLFLKFAKRSPLIVLDPAKAKRIITQQDVDWGVDEDDAAGNAAVALDDDTLSMDTEDGLVARFGHKFKNTKAMTDFMRQAWDVFNAHYFKAKLGPYPEFRTTLPRAFVKWHGAGGTNFNARGLWVYGRSLMFPATAGRMLFLHPRTFLDWSSWRKVVLHEMCHAFVSDVYGIQMSNTDGAKVNGHGPLWKKIMGEIGEPVERYDNTSKRTYMHEDERKVADSIAIRRGALRGIYVPSDRVPGDIVYYFDETKSDSHPRPGVILAKCPPRKSDKGVAHFYVLDSDHMRGNAPSEYFPRVPYYNIGDKADGWDDFDASPLEHMWYPYFLKFKHLFIK